MTLLEQLKGGLVVSCQALEGEPLHGSIFMTAMAIAAAKGGARAILANGPDDLLSIQTRVRLPLIGVMTREYPDSDITLTATLAEVDALAAAGARMVGLDATNRRRPGGESLEALTHRIRKRHPTLLLIAEIATTDEARNAVELGFDCISSAAYGYTRDTQGRRLPENDFGQLKALRAVVGSRPLFAEGGMMTPAHAARALEVGSHTVVVGGAITRPHAITASFVEALRAAGPS